MNKFQVIPFELRSLRSFTDSFPINVPKSTRHGLNPFFIQPWCHWNRFTEFYRVFVLWLSARHTRSIRYGGDEQNGNSSPSNWGHYLKGHWGLTSGREPNWKRNMWRSRKKVEERGVESEEEEQQHRKKYQTKLPFFFHPLLSAAFGIQVYHFRGLFFIFWKRNWVSATFYGSSARRICGHWPTSIHRRMQIDGRSNAPWNWTKKKEKKNLAAAVDACLPTSGIFLCVVLFLFVVETKSGTPSSPLSAIPFFFEFLFPIWNKLRSLESNPRKESTKYQKKRTRFSRCFSL